MSKLNLANKRDSKRDSPGGKGIWGLALKLRLFPGAHHGGKG